MGSAIPLELLEDAAGRGPVLVGRRLSAMEMEERHGIPARAVDARQVDAQVTAVQGRHQRRPLLTTARQGALETVGEVLGAAELEADAHPGQPGLGRPVPAIAPVNSRVNQVNTTAEPMTAKTSVSSSRAPPTIEAHGGTRTSLSTIGRWSGGSCASEPAPSQTARASPSMRTSTSSSSGMITSRSPAASLSVVRSARPR